MFWRESWGISVTTVTRLRAGRPAFDSQQGQQFFLFATASRRALGPTQPPVQEVSRFLSPEVKRPGRQADHSPPSSASFEVFTAVEIQVEVFRVVTPCNVAIGYQRFGGPCCLHLQCEVKMEAARSFISCGHKMYSRCKFQCLPPLEQLWGPARCVRALKPAGAWS
jgi:hypothetical protein